MSKVTLQVVQGNVSPKLFTFEERSTCVIGRALDCNIKLPDDQAHSTISRYHCLLDINPPDICIRDFGSLNGTYVNGEKIGQRDIDADRDKANHLIYPEYDLQNGDQFKLGDSIFEVLIPFSSDQSKKLELSQQIISSSAVAGAEKTPITQEANPMVDSLSVNPLDKINLLLGKMDDKGQDKNDKDLLIINGYDIVKELGKGSMGVVYLAQKKNSNDQINSKVALKIMLPKVETDPKAHRQFIRETKNTQLLKHKNIVKVYDVGCHDATFFFTTDYCEAGSVAQLIKKEGGKLPLYLALKILMQVLDGLEFAHTVKIPVIVLADGKKTSATGLVHRDLKPGNIMLTKADGVLQAKIADFGLSKAFDVAGLSGRTATGISAGTPFYMPRQQVINFKFAKPEVDVWAAAATFYKMVTGRYPRKYSKASDPWLTTLKTPITPIRAYDASIPESLAQVIDLALVDQPEIHYKSASEFKNDLSKVV